ncbi:MAG: 50S ribosomal protein L6 [Myxococcales bacterium]|nr:50S ribosomal protein L6 [Myxococcales bacterium]
MATSAQKSQKGAPEAAPPAAPRVSRVGKQPILVPKGVTVTLGATNVTVKGPKGELAFTLPGLVTVAQANGELNIKSSAPGRDAARLQGTARSVIANMVHGVSTGFAKTLELQGTGYRVELKGPAALNCVLGFSHQIELKLPPGVTADVPKESKGTIVTISGADKGAVGQVAATLRGYRPAEPYGGKGVRYKGERIREKAGKSGKSGKK